MPLQNKGKETERWYRVQTFALHMTNPGLIPDITYGPLRSNPCAVRQEKILSSFECDKLN